MKPRNKNGNNEFATKKPFYKKKWFIIVCALFVIGVIGNLFGDSDNQKKTANESEAKQEAPASEPDITSDEEVVEASENVDIEEPQFTTYNDGMYKIGADLPAGEYILFSDGAGYFQISSDSTGSFDSIIANDNFDYNTIVTLSEGQYFEIKRAYAIPFSENPEVDATGEGMFKVGTHLPAGEYKIASDGSGYIQVSSNSLHDLDSIVSNDNFDGEKYITVSDGQYLTVTRAHIIQ